MRIGIIGLPQSGKTTIFNALTRGDQPVVSAGGRFEMHTGVVDVPDERVDVLSEMFHPQKTTYAKVTYIDLAGLNGTADKESISGPLLTQLSQMDGFVHVVRCFENSRVPFPTGNLDPLLYLASLQGEMILNDAIIVERKLERLAEERRRGAERDKVRMDREVELFERLHKTLAEEQPVRNLALSAIDEKTLSGFGFLTRKPVLILFNTSDGQAVPCVDYPGGRCEVVALQGKLEMDIAQLSPEDVKLFMAEYGIQESGLQVVINQSYCLMGLQSFFTVGEDEVRAWTVKAGATALEAARAIHSDLQKGFIRAEVISYTDLVDLGSLAEARKRGKLRLEGKEYIVQDGDIVHFRFNL
jgi:GTP-binding protein YchF